MDQTKYWLLTRRKLSEKPLLGPHIAIGSSYCNESWEERAFAEDSAGHLGGCIWPPRSYSCSFCGREFRSAQALGGHMNVHRRDRARLKLSASADESSDGHPQNYLHPCAPLPPPYAPQIGPLAYNPNPSPNANPNPNSIRAVLAYPPSPSGSLAAAAKSSWSEHILSSPLLSSSPCQDKQKETLFCTIQSAAPEDPKPASQICSPPPPPPELSVTRDELTLRGVGCWMRREFEEDDDDDEGIIVSKRRRTDLGSPFFPRPCAGKHQQQDDAKVLKLCPTSPVEELDLELRLGEAPKVK